MIRKWILKLIGIEGPFNGWKTISGVILLLLAQMFPDAKDVDHEQLVHAVEILVNSVGIVLTAIGTIHRAWKNLRRDGANPSDSIVLPDPNGKVKVL